MTSQRSSGNVGDVSDLPPQEQHLPDLVPEEAVKKARSNEIRVFFTSRFQGYWTRVTDQWGRELGASERKAAECYLTIKKCHTLAFLAPRQFIARVAFTAIGAVFHVSSRGFSRDFTACFYCSLSALRR